MILLNTVVLLCGAACALSQSINLPGGTKPPFVRPVYGIIDEKNIAAEGNFPGGWNIPVLGSPGRTTNLGPADNAKMSVNDGNHAVFNTNRQSGTAGFQPGYVQALGPKGEIASSNLFIADDKLGGGLAQFGSETANFHETQTGDDHVFDLQQGRHNAQATADNLDNSGTPTFGIDGKNPKDGKQLNGVLDVYNQQRRSGNGEVQWSENNRRLNNVTYEQKVTEGRGNAQDTVEMVFKSKDGRIANGNTWTCQTQPAGTTQCKDENGRLVGKTVTTDPTNSGLGETLVYDKNNRVVARAKVRKVAERKYVAEVNDGLLAVNVDEFTKYDCWADANAKYGGPSTYRNSKIKVENMDVKYNTENLSGGKKKFLWPDCFQMTADVTLPANIPAKCIAWEIVVHVLPMGTYDCTDAGTCAGLGRNCYYCDLCKKRNLSILKNTAGNTCDKNTGGRHRITETVCPTPEGEKLMMCQGFDRHLLGNDYYKYNGTLNAEMRVWLRGDCLNEEQVRVEFERRVASPLERPIMAAQYKAAAAKAGENFLSGGFNLNVDKEDLYPWFKSVNYKDSLIGCQKAVVDYGLGKDGGTDVVIDQMASLGKNQKLFNGAPCPAWQAQQKQEYQESQPSTAKPSSSGNSGIGGVINQVVGGGGKNPATDLLNRFTGGSSNTGSSSGASSLLNRFGSLFGGGK